MSDKRTLVYQLLVIVLLIALVCMVCCKSGMCGKNSCPKTSEIAQTAAATVPQEQAAAKAEPQEQAAAKTEPKGTDVGNGWRRLKPSEIQENPIMLIDVYKGLLAMGNREEHNAMTIGWGSLGVLWSTPVYTVYVSSSRYSYKLLEKYDTFTVSFLNKSHLKDVMYLGHHSGRDGDKISKTNLHLSYTQNGNPMFDEAFMVIECRKIYGGPYDSTKFGDVPKQIYGRASFGVHSEYVGEIMNVFVKDENRVEK